MAIAEPNLSPIELLRRRAAESPRLLALDDAMLSALKDFDAGDFDDIAAIVGRDDRLRHGLSGWIVSAQERGLLTRLPNRGSRQWFELSELGRRPREGV